MRCTGSGARHHVSDFDAATRRARCPDCGRPGVRVVAEDGARPNRVKFADHVAYARCPECGETVSTRGGRISVHGGVVRCVGSREVAS